MKKKLSSGKWLLLFFGTVLLLALLIAAFNWLTDPFGAFGDPLLKWWSYDMTMNPRVAKVSYLEKHAGEFDGFILGASSSSSIPTAALEQALGGRFYNLFMYGGNMKAVEETARYALSGGGVKHVVLSVYIRSAVSGDYDRSSLTDGVHWRVGGNAPGFYLRYLFADPRLGLDKLRARASDGYLQTAFKVFDPETGSYDKSLRDAEPVGALSDYLSREAYAGFTDYPTGALTLDHLDDCMAHVAAIRDLCAEQGATLTVVCPPMYGQYMSWFSEADQAAFRRALAAETDYWDFTLSSISWEPRYFYDETHFRNDLGRMMIARVFGRDGVWMPEDFGQYVPRGADPGPYEALRADEEAYTLRVPVLTYHAFSETDADSAYDIVPAARFDEQLTALEAAGYTTVSPEALRAWVLDGEPLPEKPVVLTMDDGYASVYEIAYPVLQKHGACATSFVIGVSVGKDTYKDTETPITPHFGMDAIAEMEAGGLVSVQSHGYDVHEVEGLDPAPVRPGALQREGESEMDYVNYLTADAQRMHSLLPGGAPCFAYPYGWCDMRSEVILREAGVWCTFTTQEKTNVLVRGLPQSLRQLGRYNVPGDMTGEALVALLEKH